MFEDVITYCPCIKTLRIELTLNGQVDEDGKPTLSLTKTPVIHSKPDGRTLALIRLVDSKDRDTLYRLESLEVLGAYDEVFSDPVKLEKYDSVYDRTPKEEIDPETGEIIINTPPDKFCVFA